MKIRKKHTFGDLRLQLSSWIICQIRYWEKSTQPPRRCGRGVTLRCIIISDIGWYSNETWIQIYVILETGRLLLPTTKIDFTKILSDNAIKPEQLEFSFPFQSGLNRQISRPKWYSQGAMCGLAKWGIDKPTGKVNTNIKLKNDYVGKNWL